MKEKRDRKSWFRKLLFSDPPSTFLCWRQYRKKVGIGSLPAHPHLTCRDYLSSGKLMWKYVSGSREESQGEAQEKSKGEAQEEAHPNLTWRTLICSGIGSSVFSFIPNRNPSLLHKRPCYSLVGKTLGQKLSIFVNFDQFLPSSIQQVLFCLVGK